MRIWLMQTGEPLPISDDDRLLRMGILAKLLVARGHDVVWWASTFDHIRKKQRYKRDMSININNNYKIELLHSISYRNNISILRVINHIIIAYKFLKRVELNEESKPDIILCSLPTIELSFAATRYGIKKKLPVVIDIRDLWPDIFLRLVPKSIQWLAKLFLMPMFYMARSACIKATAITAINSSFIDWAVNNAKRNRKRSDQYFPLAYSDESPNTENIVEAEKFWAEYGISKNTQKFIACFFGTIGYHFELETVIKAAKKLKEKSYLFVFCGTGDKLEYYRNMSAGFENIIFPGWVGTAEIWTLLRLSSIGLAPYINTDDFKVSFPNKSIEYLSAGLPIVSSLKGALEDLLSTYNCGLTYENGNVDQLILILHNLKDDYEKFKILSDNAYKLYKENFVAESVYSNMINYLELIFKEYRKFSSINI